MGKLKKLMALLCSCTMLLSLFVFPANANSGPENILDGKVVYYNDNKTPVPLSDGIYTVTRSMPSTFYDTVIRINSISLKPGTKYVVSAYVRNGDDNVDSAWQAWFRDERGASSIPETRTTVRAGSDATEWHKVSGVYTTPAGTANTVIHVGLRLYGSADEEKVLVKDVTLYEMPGAFEVTTDFSSGSTEMLNSLTINYSFSNVLEKEIGSSDFTLTGGTGNVEVSNGTDGKTASVTLSELEFGKSYTLKLSGIKDFAGQVAEDNVISFTTVSDPKPVNIFGTKTAENLTPDNEGVYTVTRTKSNNVYDSQIRIVSNILEPDTSYIFSAYVKNADDSVDEMWQAWMMYYSSEQNSATIDAQRTKILKDSDANVWHKVTGTIKTGSNAKQTWHIGVRLYSGADADVLVKDFALYKAPDKAMTVSADMENGLKDVPLSTSVTYKFSNILDTPLTNENFVLNGGAGNITIKNDDLGISSTVMLSNLEGDTDYTLTLIGVKDYGLQAAEDYVITFTTTEDPNPTPLYYNTFDETTGFVNDEMLSIASKIDDGKSSNGIETGNALQINTDKYRVAQMRLGKAVDSGIVDFSYDFYAEKGCPPMNVYVGSSVHTSIYFGSIGLGDVIRGTIVPTVTTDEWHTVTYRVNFINRTYSVIYDGNVYVQDSYKRPLIFRDANANSTSVGTINIYSVGGADKQLQIDNFKIVRYTNKDKLFLKYPDGVVDNENLLVDGLKPGTKISDLKSVTDCEPSEAEVVIRNKNGEEKGDDEVLEHTDSLFVINKKDGVWKEYNIISGVSINLQSVNIGGMEFFDSSKINIPGEAKIRAKITNDTFTDKTLNVYAAVIGEKLYDVNLASALHFAAQDKKDVTLTVNIPDNCPEAVLKLMVMDAETLAPEVEYVSKINASSQEIIMPNIFSDNMVLQRGEEVNVFGIAPTGTEVNVSFGEYSANGIAENGEFLVKLPAMQADNNGKKLQVCVGDKIFTYSNVVVGEVIYGSGQSNMQYIVRDAAGAKNLGMIDNVRYFKVKELLSASDRIDGEVSENWVVSDSSNWIMNSATLYATAYALRKFGAIEENVPIGLINASKGGTSIGAWVSPNVLEEGPHTSYFTNYLDNIFDPRLVQNTDLYSAMAKFITPYTVKAAIWYQGENDINVSTYDWYLNSMIEEMRTDFGKDVPYYVVQLPGYSLGWEEFRLIQYKAHNPENGVNVVVTNDSGESDDIHPQDKDVVGDRIARHIAYQTFGLEIPYSGPVFNSAEVDDNVVTLSFDFVNDGIHGNLCPLASDNSITSFELSADGSTWHPAVAVINGDTVEVSSDVVSVPAYVRYGYVKEPLKSLGTNSEGVKLPLAPFRAEIK